MEWLNYHHLLYFYMVVREGGIRQGAKALRVSEPTVSQQIKTLEKALGEKLLRRSVRRLITTEIGQFVYEQADEIFTRGQDLLKAARGKSALNTARVSVGITDAMPKLLSCIILEPLLHLEQPIKLECEEDQLPRLLVDMAEFRLDAIISDVALPEDSKVRAWDRLVAQCGVSFLAAPKLTAGRRLQFPDCLQKLPLILPTPRCPLRRSLDQWFRSENIQPLISGEFGDSALLSTFGQLGHGIFPVPTLVEKSVCTMYGVRRIASLRKVKQRFYAIFPEKRITHPGLAAICSNKRTELFR